MSRGWEPSGQAAAPRFVRETKSFSVDGSQLYPTIPLLTEGQMGLSNAERQRRYIQRLKARASGVTNAPDTRQADYAWTVLALILAWGKDRGRITVNPCEKGG